MSRELKDSPSRVVNIGELLQKESTLKFLVIGASNVGKTSILYRYVENRFYTNVTSTVGIDFQRKLVQYTPNHTVHVQLWDMAGNEKFRCMPSAYYRNSQGVALVFDVTKPDTLNVARDWLNDIRNCACGSDGTQLPVVLMANKGDLSSVVTNETIVKFCEDNDVEAWCFTSARLNWNIDKTFSYLVDKAIRNMFGQTLNEDSVKLNVKKSRKNKKGCCDA